VRVAEAGAPQAAAELLALSDAAGQDETAFGQERLAVALALSETGDGSAALALLGQQPTAPAALLRARAALEAGRPRDALRELGEVAGNPADDLRRAAQVALGDRCGDGRRRGLAGGGASTAGRASGGGAARRSLRETPAGGSASGTIKHHRQHGAEC
jgi:hypothetical protein